MSISAKFLQIYFFLPRGSDEELTLELFCKTMLRKIKALLLMSAKIDAKSRGGEILVADQGIHNIETFM